MQGLSLLHTVPWPLLFLPTSLMSPLQLLLLSPLPPPDTVLFPSTPPRLPQVKCSPEYSHLVSWSKLPLSDDASQIPSYFSLLLCSGSKYPITYQMLVVKQTYDRYWKNEHLKLYYLSPNLLLFYLFIFWFMAPPSIPLDGQARPQNHFHPVSLHHHLTCNFDHVLWVFSLPSLRLD